MTKVKQLFLPVCVFLLVGVGHYLWLGFFPEQNNVQDLWLSVEEGLKTGWLERYINNQDYWLGFTYALTLAFTAYAINRYRLARAAGARNAAIGSGGLAGFLAAAGCFLTGCCGSPMLVVYLNLFGGSFLPLVKPLIALITTITITGAWLWMHYRRSSPKNCTDSCCNQVDTHAECST